MKITDFNPDNTRRFNIKIAQMAEKGPYEKLVNFGINLTCKIFDKGSHFKVKISDAYTWKSKTRSKNKIHNNVAIVAGYDSNGIIKEYTMYYLKKLSESFDTIILIMDNQYAEQDLNKFENIVDLIIFKRHGRFDFGSWHIGITYLKENHLWKKVNRLLLTNDSCYGPVYNLNNIIKEMNGRPSDFWGLLDSKDRGKYHILSFFMMFKERIIRDKCFEKFFERLPAEMTWDEAVYNGELKITEYLINNGYKCDVYRKSMYENFRSIIAGNRNTTLWPVTCLKQGIPLIKVKALNSKYSFELNEGISDTLYIIKNTNHELYEIIVEDIKKRSKKDNENILFDSFSNTISDLIENKEIISFDIFDTLLYRPCVVPTDSFILIGQQNNEPSFVTERIEAEKRARKTGKEVNIDDIYAEMPEKYYSFKKIELEYEKRILYANPNAKKMYDEAIIKGKKVICISDMYLPSSFLNEILIKNGYDNIFKIFVSCEYNKTKWQGTLYDQAVEELKVDKTKIIHFGDNVESDVNSAKKMGIEAHLVCRTLDRFTNAPANIKFMEFFGKNTTITGAVHLSLINKRRAIKTINNTFWEDMGYNLGGPIVLSYLNFITKTAKDTRCDKLFFVARDGYILKKVYDAFFKNESGIESSYVYLTRHVGLTSTLDYLGEETYVRTILEYASKKLSINVSESFEDNVKEFDNKKDELIKWANEKYINFEKYLNKIAAKSDRIMIVDMATGLLSSYRFAKKILGDRIKYGTYIGSFKDNPDLQYTTFLKRPLNSSDDPVIKLSEILISSPEAPIMEISDNGSPIYGSDINNKTKIYPEIEKGIMDYCTDYLSIIGNGPFMTADEWFSLAMNYVLYANDVDLFYLDEMLDTPHPENEKNAKKLSELFKTIRRQNGII